MTDRARLGPSNTRWPKCAGSVALEAQYPDTTNDAAIEGVGAHLLIEYCLLQGKQPADLKGQTIGEGHKDKPKGWKVTDARIDAAEYVFAYLNRHPDAEIEAESKSNPGEKFGRDDWYGTADITIRKPNYLEVVDYKNGRTHVDEKNNSQLISYAYGKWEGEENIRMTIIQPKSNMPIRYWDITGLELKEKTEELAEAAARTDAPDAPLTKGSWCHWCKHKPNCKTYNEDAMKITLHSGLQKHFAELIDNVEGMSDNDLTEILDAEAVVSALFDKARAEAEARLDSGKKINGWRMSPGRSTRKWNDEEALKKYLKAKKVKVSDYTETKLKSPAQIEKLKVVDKDELEEFIHSETGSMKLSKAARIVF